MKTRLLYILIIFLSFTAIGFSQTVNVGDDIEICDGQAIVLDATTQNATAYQWSQDGQTIAGETSATLVVTQSGLYEATVIVNGITSSDDSLVTFSSSPAVNNPSDSIIETTTNATSDVFDLTVKIPEIINGNTNLQITFYESFVEAQNELNPIVNPTSYTNLTNPQTIFARAQDPSLSCFAVVNFDLEIITYTSVDCSQAPITTTYCYTNNDDTEFRFRSTSGSPVTIEFIEGMVEENWDELIIIDSDDITVLYTGYGNNGDVTGLIFESTGDEITVKIDSDGSISCQNSFVPLQFQASCLDTSVVGIINVRSFLDDNTNGTYDVGEVLVPFGNVLYEENDDGIINVGTTNQIYTILSDDGANTYDITFDLFPEYVNCYTIATPTINDVNVAIGNAIFVDFPLTAPQACEDIEVLLINTSRPPRPGFTHDNLLMLKNNSTTTVASGTIEFVVDNLLVFNNIISINSNYTVTNTATGFTVDFVNLAPFATELIEIELLCPVTVALGEITTNTVTYTTDTNDLVLGNNTSSLEETVIGSWDPNDITESRGPEIIHEDFTSQDYLYYTIRFQNLGTAEAVNVRIEETLDTELDETTFQMVASSHDFQVVRTNDELVWRFDDINLPAEMFDADGSNGFVYFKIKPKAGYAIGDIIPGVAGIYFDFNAPVITNTFETKFVAPLSVGEVSSINVTTYPNPATDILYVTFDKNETSNVRLFDVQGKQILQQVEDSKTIELNVSSLQSGIYFLKLTTATAQFTKKIIVN
ncbi:T9SS type A sorting domain-containing protein [Kordia sp. YSTF-M3]|uniref:T9SS type A sorting domain-containing protein n=1 Tax=Kordia aestuariivivens TaxID=2759037 RepID=A0ABR7QA23_9FLAO|nr:T9SS type A sorting domain-containing protein [Kordia aestuariivivens]MBC8755414.1 T9SS type A sorting domain-containing protein [Kordia aestuariivivens]